MHTGLGVLCVLLLGVGAAVQLPWTRGRYAKFTLNADMGYTVTYQVHPTGGSYTIDQTLHSHTAMAPLSSSLQPIEGTDPLLGDWDGVSTGDYAVKYYERMDAFTFSRTLAGDGHDSPVSTFPALVVGNGTGSSINSCIAYQHTNFLAGGLSTSLNGCSKNDGPLMLFNNDSSKLETLVVSGADHFTTHTWGASVLDSGSSPSPAPTNEFILTDSVVGMNTVPKGTVLTTVMLARPRLARALAAWGSFLRQAHNTTRSRGSALSRLSYW
jgi:hypothetical protein